MNKKEIFRDIVEFRHACKIFDKDKIIPKEDLFFILDMGRLSPSSFGMEGWKFIAIQNPTLKEKLKPVCWNQEQITTCSDLVVILAAIDQLKPSSGIVAKKFARRGLPKERYEAYIDVYSNFLKDEIDDDEKMFCWSSKQTYLAAMSMMLAAASVGVDSCPIEGFEREKVEDILGIDRSKYRVSLLLPLGYRVNPQPKHLREKLEDIVEFVI